MTRHSADITTFLRMAGEYPVADVRSPSEYSAGHIPGAVNIPLFNDREREIVGTKYKKEGRMQSILSGLELSGPSLRTKLETALRAAGNGKLLVYCWRGGMRSEAMSWLFSLGGIETIVLEGGYKAYRRYVLGELAADRKMIVLGGLTGSGKTRILKHLGENGHQVIDLEGLANHKGSAFGSLGQPSQPSSEQFANLLCGKLLKCDPYKPVWIEDESRNIGSVFMPVEFYLSMQRNMTIVLLMDVRTRLPRLLEEYSCYHADELSASVERISRRMGGERAKEALEAIKNGDFAKAITVTLDYYDRTYLYGLKRKDENRVVLINTDTDDVVINAARVADAAREMDLL